MRQGKCVVLKQSLVLKQYDFPLSKALIPISETLVVNPDPNNRLTCFLPPLPLQLHHNSCTTLASQGPTPLQLCSSKIVFPPFLHEIFYLCRLHFWHLRESPLFCRTNHTRFSAHPLGNRCLHPRPSTLSRGEGALPERRALPCPRPALGAAFAPHTGLEVMVQRPSPPEQPHCRGAEGCPRRGSAASSAVQGGWELLPN